MNKLIVMTVAGDAKMTQFMQAADVFEQFKVLGERHDVTLTFADDVEPDTERINKTILSLREAFEKSGKIVSFIGALALMRGKTTEAYPDSTPYWNDKVITVSSGTKYFMLADLLRHTGWEVEEAKHGLLYITKVTPPQC